MPTQAVLLCGGRGERLRPLTDTLPKPMAPVLGRPFLEYLIEQLRDAGLRQIVLLTGYRGRQIAEHFGNGQRFGIRIRHVEGVPEWETGRRLAEAASLLEDRFLLLYGDNLAPFRLDALWRRHQDARLPVTVTLARKDGGNIRLNHGGEIETYDPRRAEPGLTHVEIGYMIVEKAPVLALSPWRGSFSLVLRELARAGRLAAFDPGWPYYSISDLDRLRHAEQCLAPRRLLLLDRDGVINRKAPRGEYVWRKEDFTWIPENLAGLEHLADEGFEFLVLSNQAGIARGIMDRQAVDRLHAWMVRELRQRGIVVRDVLICPHHWDDGCSCRKPRAGLFFEASRRHGFFLERTAYIGDDERDAQAAGNAGCPCVLLGEQNAVAVMPEHRAANLCEAVPWILDRFCRWESAFQAVEVLS